MTTPELVDRVARHMEKDLTEWNYQVTSELFPEAYRTLAYAAIVALHGPDYPGLDGMKKPTWRDVP